MKAHFAAIAFGAVLALGGQAQARAADTETHTAAAETTTIVPSEHKVGDAWITTKVKSELATTKGIKSGEIEVTTQNGLVTLSGTVDSKAQAQKAVAVAKSVKGVRHVDSTMLSSHNN
jgi:hyperosmotically inducible protein